MKYIDIHTHTVIPKTQENRISFYNRIVGRKTESLFTTGSSAKKPWVIYPI